MQTKTRRLLQPIWNIFDAHFTPKKAGGIILCVSGGSDSLALLEAVAHWPRRFERIFVVSVDHATRLRTAFEAQSVCARARVLGFESQLLSLLPQVKKDEASLRQRRYAAIWQFAREQGISAIVTAHTEDDQAESFVMDLMGQGGGPDGAGMQIVMPARHVNATIIRPLLSFSRAYLIAVLTALDIHDYFVDPTNEHSEGKRVQVRNFLSLHSAPKPRLAMLAERRRQDVETLREMAGELVSVENHQVRVNMSSKIAESIKFQALKLALGKLLPGQDLRSAHQTLKRVSGVPGKTYDLPGCILEVGDGEVILSSRA